MARLILVADDSPTVQRRAQVILQGEGFEVETVSNGVAAIKKLPNLQPVLVLADVSMPGKDGYEVCDYVKASADLRHVPVLLVGSDLEPYDEQRGAQVGADGIIKKPFTPEDLIGMVAKFTGLGKAPPSPPTLADTLVTSFPAAPPEVPPTSSAAEPSTRLQEQDLATLPVEVALAGPPLDEIPATPAAPPPDFPLQPSLEPARQVWAQAPPEPPPAAPPEHVAEGSPGPWPVPPESFRGFEREVTPTPTPELGLEHLPESALVSPELISKAAAPEAVPEPTLVSPEPTPEGIPEAAPEPTRVMPEWISETAPEAMPEPTLVSPEPTPERIPEAAPEPARLTPELTSEAAPEVWPEPTLLVPEPSPAPPSEAALEPALVTPEFISEIAPEGWPEPRLPTPEPTPEGIAEAVPELALVSPELLSETAPEASAEHVSAAMEPVAEPALPFTRESATETVHPAAEAVPEALPVEGVPPPTEPLLPEKQAEPIAPPAASPELVTPRADRTAEFLVPGGIAGPVLVDELASALSAPKLHPSGEAKLPKPKVATSLNGFSLAEAAEGQVRVAPPVAEVVQPGRAPAGPPSVVDREWVYAVVRKVVLKMAPPALPPELVEEIIRMLTDEITAELNAASSRAY